MKIEEPQDKALLKEAVKIKVENSSLSIKVPIKKEHKDNSEVQLIGETTNEGKPNKISENEHFELLNHVLNMLDLRKVNVPGLGDYQLLAVCLVYFGRRRHDESDRNKDITAFK